MNVMAVRNDADMTAVLDNPNKTFDDTHQEFCSSNISSSDPYKVERLEAENLKKDQKIAQLEYEKRSLQAQLAIISTCEQCKEKSSIPLQEKTESPGTAVENSEEVKAGIDKSESDVSSDDEIPADLYRCRHASCQLDALVVMFYKLNIIFCIPVLLQMIGKVTGDERDGLSCSHILKNVMLIIRGEKYSFFRKLYAKEIEDENKKEEVSNAIREFRISEQKAGILTYYTDSCMHSVSIYKSKSGKIKIYDATDNTNSIEKVSLKELTRLEVCVLACDENGETFITKKWSKCDAQNCKNRMDELEEGLVLKTSMKRLALEIEQECSVRQTHEQVKRKKPNSS